MPLPKPRQGEKKSDWMDRCMADKTMNSDFPKTGQRFAVCKRQWNASNAAYWREQKEIEPVGDDELQADLDAAERQMPNSLVKRRAQKVLELLRSKMVEGLREIVRSVIAGRIKPDNAVTAARAVMVPKLLDAAVLGFRIAGLKDWKLTDEQLDAIMRLIESETEYFAAFVGALASEQMDPDRRVELYGGSVGDSFWRGWTMAMPSTATIWWRLSIAEHCCATGTPVLLSDGNERPIENVRVGDVVTTACGPQKVTKVQARWFYGELVRVGNVRMTPEHRVATHSGWQRADKVTDPVGLEQCSEALGSQLALPDTEDDIVTGAKVAFPAAVTALLGFLAICERLEPGMAVPIIPVDLQDDRVTDDEVNNELRFELDLTPVFDTERVEELRSQLLRLTGPTSLVNPTGTEGYLERFLSVIDVPLSDSPSPLEGTGRVVLPHVIASPVMNDPLSRLLAEAYPELIGAVSHCLQWFIESLGQFGRTLRRVQLTNDLILLIGPRRLAAPADGTLGIVADSTTDRTRGPFAPDLAVGESAVSTVDRAELRGPTVAERPASRRSHLDLRPTLLTSKRCLVYDLTIEHAGHFIADGLIVHNCPDCLALAAGSPYDKPGMGPNPLPTVPRNGDTRCVIDPWATVKTRRGDVPISRIQPGDEVMTHRGRWRQVTAVNVSTVGDRDAYNVGGNRTFRVTGDHALLTPLGWVTAAIIDKCQLPVYRRLHVNLPTMRDHDPLRQPIGTVQGVCERLSRMRQSQESSVRTLQVLRHAEESTEAMARYTISDSSRAQRWWHCPATAIQGLAALIVQLAQVRWAAIRLLLERRWLYPQMDLSLPMDMGASLRPDSRWLCGPSHRGSFGRPTGESCNHAGRQPQSQASNCSGSQLHRARRDESKESIQMSGVRREVRRILARPEETAHVLLSKVLPRASTRCWDITVAEDHSFICEDVVLHNCLGNCRCFLTSEGVFDSSLFNKVGVEVTTIGGFAVDPMSDAAIAAAALYQEFAERYAYHLRMSLLESGHGAIIAELRRELKALAQQLGHSVRFTQTRGETLHDVRLARSLGYKFIKPIDLSDDLVTAVAVVIAMNSTFRGKITAVSDSPPAVWLDDTDEFRLDAVGRNILFVIE